MARAIVKALRQAWHGTASTSRRVPASGARSEKLFAPRALGAEPRRASSAGEKEYDRSPLLADVPELYIRVLHEGLRAQVVPSMEREVATKIEVVRCSSCASQDHSNQTCMCDVCILADFERVSACDVCAQCPMSQIWRRAAEMSRHGRRAPGETARPHCTCALGLGAPRGGRAWPRGPALLTLGLIVWGVWPDFSRLCTNFRIRSLRPAAARGS